MCCTGAKLRTASRFIPGLLRGCYRSGNCRVMTVLSRPTSARKISFPVGCTVVNLGVRRSIGAVVALSGSVVNTASRAIVSALKGLDRCSVCIRSVGKRLRRYCRVVCGRPIRRDSVEKLILSAMSGFCRGVESNE